MLQLLSINMDNDRKRMFEAIQEYGRLAKQKDQIEIQLWRLARFIRASAGILPDKDRSKVEKRIAEMFGQAPGVTDAVRIALRSHPGKWMRAPTILAYLEDIGFDFSGYTGNPLTSIHIVAKRMSPRGVEVNGSGDEVSYRWKGK
jgi:hypothetical protein